LPIHDSFIVESKQREELLHMMKKAFKDRYGQECGIEIDDPVMFENIRWAIEKRQEVLMGKYTDKMRNSDDEWVEIMYSRYNQMLTEFAEVKGVKIPEPDVDAVWELLKHVQVLLKMAHKIAKVEKAAE